MIDGADSTVISHVPRDAGFVVCYSDGRYRNEAEARAQFSHLPPERILALAVAFDLTGQGVDTEPGNISPRSAAQAIKDEIARGSYRPVGYADLTDMRTLISELHLIGVPTPPAGPGRPWRCYTAHPTGTPHLCGPRTCGQLQVDADITQWWWSSLQNPGGPDLDRDVARDDAFPGHPTPTPDIPEDTMAIAMGTNQDGRLAIAVELSTGEVKHIEQQAANGDWWKDDQGQPRWLSLGNPGK